MNTASMNTSRVPTGDITKVGDFTFDEERETLYVWLPGSTGPDAISITRGNEQRDRLWKWDGNEDRPTLTPSIKAPEWHWYLTAGRLISC